MSLYDYLGYAAGSKLGKEVATSAGIQGIPHRVKHVQNSKYTGEIMMYPVDFLDNYFNKP